jgi:hypothetical protein
MTADALNFDGDIPPLQRIASQSGKENQLHRAVVFFAARSETMRYKSAVP